MQSSSASLNAYYGMALLGDAIGDTNIYNFARLMMAMEMKSAKKYFHITDDSIYPASFAANGMVGVLWDTKADFRTYDG